MPARPPLGAGAGSARRRTSCPRATPAAWPDKTPTKTGRAAGDAPRSRSTAALQTPTVGELVESRAPAVVGRETATQQTTPDEEVAPARVGVGDPIPAPLRRALGGAAGVVGLNVPHRAGETAGALAGHPCDVTAAQTGAGDMGGGACRWVLAETVERKAAGDEAAGTDPCRVAARV